MVNSLKQKARALKTETYALSLAYQDPRTPWVAKAFAALVVAYAFSPIDLIPDFIPVLGYLDDLLIVPLGIFLAIKLIPVDVMEQARGQAKIAQAEGRLQSRTGLAIVIGLWIIGLLILAALILRFFER